MKRIKLILLAAFILIAVLMMLVSCNDIKEYDKNQIHEQYYLNDTSIIIKHAVVATNGYLLLIRRLKDTTDFTELNSQNFNLLQPNRGSKYYWSKNIGDTLVFNYVCKDRFWKKIK